MPTDQLTLLTGAAVTETLKKCDVVVKEATYAEPSTEGGIDVERKAGGLQHSFLSGKQNNSYQNSTNDPVVRPLLCVQVVAGRDMLPGTLVVQERGVSVALSSLNLGSRKIAGHRAETCPGMYTHTTA